MTVASSSSPTRTKSASDLFALFVWTMVVGALVVEVVMMGAFN